MSCALAAAWRCPPGRRSIEIMRSIKYFMRYIMDVACLPTVGNACVSFPFDYELVQVK